MLMLFSNSVGSAFGEISTAVVGRGVSLT